MGKKVKVQRGSKVKDSLSSLDNYQMVPVKLLKKAPWNYKADDEQQAAKLTNNIRRNKQVVNIIVRELPDGSFEVVDGNHRVDTFNELGVDKVVAYNLGKVSILSAKRLAMEINETRFASDHVRMAEIIRELHEKVGMDDLEHTMPFSREDLESYIKLVEFDIESFRKKKIDEITVPEDKLGGLHLHLEPKDRQMWERLKKAFQGITSSDEEIFRIVCKDYLRRVGKKKKMIKRK